MGLGVSRRHWVAAESGCLWPWSAQQPLSLWVGLKAAGWGLTPGLMLLLQVVRLTGFTLSLLDCIVKHCDTTELGRDLSPDPSGSQLFVFGGYSHAYAGCRDDAWALDMEHGIWTALGKLRK